MYWSFNRTNRTNNNNNNNSINPNSYEIYKNLNKLNDKINYINQNVRNKPQLLTDIMIFETNYFILEFIFKICLKECVNLNLTFIQYNNNNLFHQSKIFRLSNSLKKHTIFNNNIPIESFKNQLLGLFSENMIKNCEIELKKDPKLFYNFLIKQPIPFCCTSLDFFCLKHYYENFLHFLMLKDKSVLEYLSFKCSTFQEICCNIFLNYIALKTPMKGYNRDDIENNTKELLNKIGKNIAIRDYCTLSIFYLESS